MGDISDYYRNQELEHDLDMSSKLKQSIPKPQFKYWETRTNEIIHIKDMTSLHLKNSINKIKSESWRQDWLEPLENELELRRKTLNK